MNNYFKLLMICVSIFSACNFNHSNSKHSKQETENKVTKKLPVQHNIEKDSFATDSVVPSVQLKNGSGSFALFLPSKYNSTSHLPVIIFFDPHGKGSYPLKLYKDLADSFGFILIGSNDSRNGLNLDQTNRIAQHLMEEAISRFKADKDSVTFCGLSGGAKVALLSGSENPVISSVIYCGAVVPINPNHQIKLLGFAGVGDMNYTEVVQFHWKLPASPNYRLVQWNGGHEFPSAAVFKDAFIFLEKGIIPDYQKKKVTITPKEVAEEEQIKQKYLQAFQAQNMDWWRKEINSLKAKQDINLMSKRLLGFISLACYSYTGNALKQNNMEIAGKMLDIYQMADPDNEDYQKFRAEYERNQ